MQEVPAHQSIYLVPLQFGDLQDSILLHLDYTAVMDKAHFRGSPESHPGLCWPRRSTFHFTVSFTFTSNDCLWCKAANTHRTWLNFILNSFRLGLRGPLIAILLLSWTKLCAFKFSVSVTYCAHQHVWQPMRCFLVGSVKRSCWREMFWDVKYIWMFKSCCLDSDCSPQLFLLALMSARQRTHTLNKNPWV